MTHLRKMMLEELQRRNYAETTIGSYIRIVEDFSRRFQRPPDRLGPQHIREYQSELFRKRKLAASTVTVYLAALRFFYSKTLKKSWSAAETPYPKRAEHVPSILSQQEVARLIDAADNSFHRTLLITLYATGVRRAELTHLKISDVDSQRMVIHVQGGKGRKDRDVCLVQSCSRNCVSTGGGYGESQASGCFRAIANISTIDQFLRKWFGMPAGMPPSEPAS